MQASVHNGVMNQQARRCASLLREEKYSMLETSRRTGVSVGYVKQTAKWMGMSVDDRRQTDYFGQLSETSKRWLLGGPAKRCTAVCRLGVIIW